MNLENIQWIWHETDRRCVFREALEWYTHLWQGEGVWTDTAKPGTSKKHEMHKNAMSQVEERKMTLRDTRPSIPASGSLASCSTEWLERKTVKQQEKTGWIF